MNSSILCGAAYAAVVLVVTIADTALADGFDVFNMPPGVTSLQFVTIGNPGNPGELSGQGAGGYGPDRICGAVSYAYKIGKFEVTAGQYCQFLNAVAKTDPYGLYNVTMASLASWGCDIQRSGSPGSYDYSVADDWANRPVNFVSWGDAARFANWLTNAQPTGILTGNPAQDGWLTEDGSYDLNGATTSVDLMAVTRKADALYVIPTEDEWYKAAYYDPNMPGGAGYWLYPTRSSNTAPSNVLDPNGTNNANYNNNGYTIGSPYYRTEVGAFANSPGPYGTFDQGGNVWEWNEANLAGSHRGVRGGSFKDSVSYLLAADRDDLDPTVEFEYIGFRVAQFPEPGAMALLALGGIGMLLQRRIVRR